MISAAGPTVEVTTGRPNDIASTFVKPNPSAWVGIAKASASG